MRYLFIALLTTGLFRLDAQDFTMEFGKISQAEMDLTAYSKDPDARALVLFDLGDSYFFDHEGGYNIRFTRIKRIKIFDRSAAEVAEVSIPFYVDGYGKTEEVVSIEAFTYNFEGGRPIKKALDPAAVYEEQLGERWRAKKFVFPDVKAGSIIEYKYVLETPFHFNLPDWTFQDKIPTAYSQYTISLIPFYEYTFLAQGFNKFDYQHTEKGKVERTWGNVGKAMGQNYGSGVEFHDNIHTYALKDIPAFKDESYITSPDDYLKKMDFQLSRFYRPQGGSNDIITTWDALIETLSKHDNFGDFIKSSRRIAQKILKEELDLAGVTGQEKAEKIIDYTKKNFNWNRINAKFSAKPARDLLSQKTGNAAEINLFLVALLQEAGLKAFPVIISTRNHGKINRDYPFEHFFNYVLAGVETDMIFLADATETALPFNRIPPKCVNDLGLIIKEDGEPMWLNLESDIVALENKQISIQIDPEQLTAQTTVSIQATENNAYLFREQFKDDIAEMKSYFLQKGLTDIEQVRTSKYDQPQMPYIIGIKGKAKVEKIGTNLILNPFLGFAMQENLLKQETRTYPVDFIFPRSDQFRISIAIPENYQPAQFPDPYQEENSLIDIKLSYEALNNNILIQGHYTIKKSVYPPEEYLKIKGYLDTIVAKFNKEIVLQKK